jgi:hypothetical protein
MYAASVELTMVQHAGSMPRRCLPTWPAVCGLSTLAACWRPCMSVFPCCPRPGTLLTLMPLCALLQGEGRDD